MANRRAFFDYDILEKFEAGVVLTGAETKSAKEGSMSLAGSRALFMDAEGEGGEELFMVGVQINPYSHARNYDYDPLRSRKLLLTRAELVRLKTKLMTKGLTLVPLACYNKGGLIKIELGLVRGKKRFEKREELKKREVEREIEQRVKTSQRR